MGYAINASWAESMDANTRFHRFRYHLARGYIKLGDVVLDLGCGTGYGTNIIADLASSVTAIDMEKSNIDACKEKYSGENIEFKTGNLEEIELPKCNVAVMFEVLEHLYKPQEFVNKLMESVSDYIIMSVPLGQELVWVSEANEYQERGDSTHKSVFSNEQSLIGLFKDPWQFMWGFRDGVTYIVVLSKNGKTN